MLVKDASSFAESLTSGGLQDVLCEGRPRGAWVFANTRSVSKMILAKSMKLFIILDLTWFGFEDSMI